MTVLLKTKFPDGPDKSSIFGHLGFLFATNGVISVENNNNNKKTINIVQILKNCIYLAYAQVSSAG